MGGVRVLAVSDQVRDGLAAGMTAGMAAGRTAGPGNHDPALSGYRQSRTGLFTLAGFPVTPPWPVGALSADGRVVHAAGLRIAGLGGCLRYAEGPNQYTERQQARRARRLCACARRPAARSRASGQHTAEVRMAGRTSICCVTGWRVLEVTPGSGLTELLGGPHHAV
jgi:hypothetical protein